MRVASCLPVGLVVFCGCAHAKPAPLRPLSANESSVVGCYELHAEPWSPRISFLVDYASSAFRLQLDSSESVAGRRLVVRGARGRSYRYAYWNANGPDAVEAKFVYGREGQGYEFQLRVAGDSVRGTATFHLGIGDWQTAPVSGIRRACVSERVM